ncbi:MAG TPA: outer membrane protein assembly factor BamA [Steroidobacteraceae bacterium]
MIIPTCRAKARALIAALLMMIVPGALLAQEFADLGIGSPDSPADNTQFTVSNIRIEGLQRISEGTVFNYLPVNIGDHLDAQRVREAIRALYATGFFRDVELRREGTVLIVAVAERPSLESVDIKGNKDIKTEDLQKSLRNVGLSAGKTFDRSTLDEVTQYLTDQYYSRGKYAVQIDTKVENLPDNRVRVSINIKEGSRAKIRQINIVGNTAFKEKDILATLSLQTPNWQSWYKQSDRYSRETLQGDLEKIQTYYQDRGYANFRLDSVQVAIAPDKGDIFITANITEGKIYKLGEIKLAGNLIIPEAEMKKLLLVAPGQTYSQKTISATQEQIKNRLGAQGFYFAKVEPVPQSDEARRIVNLTLFVDPGSRVYVRHINFTGTTRSDDESMRRELRQLEGAWLSNVALERSKQRLERLAFVESVDMSTEPVTGSPDLVDVNFAVKERPSATVGGGVGYSAAYGLSLNGNLSDSNFFGGGDFVALNVDAGAFNKVYSFSETDPYRSVDGLSRTIALSYRDSTQFVSESSSFTSKNIALGLTYGYPISEYQGVSAGVSLQHIDLLTFAAQSAQQAVDWVMNNGRPYTTQSVSTFIEPDGTTTTAATTLVGSRYTNIELSAGWQYDSRNRALFADRGLRSALSLTYVPPGADVRYLIGSYQFSGYLPLWRSFVLTESLQIAYGKGIGGTHGLPPYKRFYAGGPDTVRGYTEDTLGPVDTNGNPYGGNMLAVSRTELLLPIPQKWQTSARVSVFYDMGNVFSNDGTRFVGEDLQTPINYNFSYHALRDSTGLSVQWLAPSLGIFRFSYGIALNPSRGTSIDFPDSTEGFQFSVGQSF